MQGTVVAADLVVTALFVGAVGCTATGGGDTDPVEDAELEAALLLLLLLLPLLKALLLLESFLLLSALPLLPPQLILTLGFQGSLTPSLYSYRTQMEPFSPMR